jgi:type I restriction enzyme, S subunit
VKRPSETEVPEDFIEWPVDPLDRLVSPARYPDFSSGEMRRSNWVSIPIYLVARLRAEKANPKFDGYLPFVGMDDIETDGLEIKRTRPFSEMRSAGNRFRTGDLLYGRLRPYLNKTAVAAYDGACSGELLAIEANEAIDIRYLQYFLHSRRFVNWITATTTGDRPRASFETLAGFAIPLAPLAEQRRIVERIDTLFAEIAEGEAALAEARKGLDLFRRSLLKAAVTGELTRDWRAVNKPAETGAGLLAQIGTQRSGSNCTRKSDLSNLPSGWTWCAVKDAGEVQLGRQRAPQHHNGEHMRPYLRVANVLENKLDFSDVKSMNFTPEEFETFALQPGDVLLNEGQAPDLPGRPAVYRGEIEGCCFQKTLLRFRARLWTTPEFALLVFRHYMHSGRFKRESRITTNIGHLTQVRFVAMEFPLPPLDEQRIIVDLVTKAEDEAGTELQNIPDASQLKQSILKAAFEGRLVPQDPNDEPASTLLARLGVDNSRASQKRRGQARRRAIDLASS